MDELQAVKHKMSYSIKYSTRVLTEDERKLTKAEVAEKRAREKSWRSKTGNNPGRKTFFMGGFGSGPRLRSDVPRKTIFVLKG